ncbi:hypothetical protein RHGRI_029251 [Rhododendron griersonianum]|uniref:Uncharacterized protein n=1 Tax=Rhododendron griersonianum TaxID=479676 RepID=A0AAV6IIJ8_9ERIC|nr:hypothetical protein RHGRI_029251 [Rhododendron griersonianum]
MQYFACPTYSPPSHFWSSDDLSYKLDMLTLRALWHPNIPSLFKSKLIRPKGSPDIIMTLILLFKSGWGHHPKLSWTQQAPPTNLHSYSTEFENKVLQALQRLEASTRLLNSHTPSINKLETHMSQLGDTINTSKEGNFSSQPVSNFMDEFGLGSSQEKNIYHEEVNETMTLLNEMVGETKSVDDNGDMGELMTNPMGLEIEVRRLLCSARPVAIQTSVNPKASDQDLQQAQLWQLAQRTTTLPLGHGAFTIATTSTLFTEALRVPKLVLAGRLLAQQNAIVCSS